MAAASEKQVALVQRLFPELQAKMAAVTDEQVSTAVEALLTPVQDSLVAVLSGGEADKFGTSKAIDALFQVDRLLGKAVAKAQLPGLPANASRVIVNRFAKPCVVCGDRVEEQAGHAVQVNGAWRTYCATCADTDPAERAAQEEAKRVQAKRVHAMIANLRVRIIALGGSDTRDHAVRVAVPGSLLDVDNSEAAYKVSWGAHRGVVRQVGAPGSVRSIDLGLDSSEELLRYLLVRSDAELLNFQAAYGQHFHECGRCGSPLSDDASKARGLGPDCASRGL